MIPFRSPFVSRVVLLVAVVATVSACSSTSKVKVDYQAAKSLPTLEIPPDLDSLPNQDGASTYSAYAAERKTTQIGSSALLPVFSKIEIKQDGQFRWLEISGKGEKLWTAIKDFFGDVGLVIARENRTTGVIETDWAENRAGKGNTNWLSKAFTFFRSTRDQDKYRARLERLGGDRYAIYLTHQGLQEVVASGGGDSVIQTMWQRRPADPELEAEMLRLLMVYLGVEDARARGMLSSGIRQSRAVLSADVLTIRTAFAPAIRRVELSLDRMGAKVTSTNRGGALIGFDYLLPSKEPKNRNGFLSKWFGTKKPRAFHVLLSNVGNQTELRVVDASGEADTSPAANELIKVLFEHLK